MAKDDSDLVPFYAVWDVVLSSGVLGPAICKLLCCSNAMARLVHRTCFGRSQLCSSCPANVPWTWLARHAPLLHSLKVTRSLQVASADAESTVAAALTAASCEVCGPITRGRAAAASSKQQQSTAIAAAAGTYSPVGPLPLRILVLEGPFSSGSIVRAVQRSPQLSVLGVEFAVGIPARQLAIAARAVATMEALEEITIKQGEGVQLVTARTTATALLDLHVLSRLAQNSWHGRRAFQPHAVKSGACGWCMSDSC
jgi:hypothetical protein